MTDVTNLLTTIPDVFWTIMDLLDQTSLALCSQVNTRWHALVRARPAAGHRTKPAYQIWRLLQTPTLLEWGWKHAPQRERRKFCKTAAARGDLQSLQWLRTERAAPWDESVCAAAAHGGHLSLLQWARKAGAPWNASVLQNAAKGGHFATFRWARGAKAPWDGKVLRTAAKYGSFEIFRWCFRHRAPSTDTMERFAGYFTSAGCLEAVRWIYEREFLEDERMAFDSILVTAAAGGHLQILRWLFDADLVDLDEDTAGVIYDTAAVHGRLVVMQWLQRHGFPPSQYIICEQAAAGGHLECLRWALAQGAALSPEVLVCAAQSGHLPLLQWVCAQGVPWTNNVFSAAVDSKNVKLLQWVLDEAPKNRAGQDQWLDPDDPRRIEALTTARSEETCIEAARNGELPVLEWALAHGAEITTRRAGALAAMGGHLGVVEWLHAHGAPIAWDLVVEYAAAMGHLPVVQWAIANGAPREKICSAAMSDKGRFEVLRWAVDVAKAGHCETDHPMFYASLWTMTWAHTRGFQINSNRAYLEAAKCDDGEMLRWVLQTFGPPGAELYRVALEARAADFLDRLRKHGVEWGPSSSDPARYALAPNGPEQVWMAAIGSPWGDGEAPTDDDESSSQSDEGTGEYPRSTQEYYESLSSGGEENNGEPGESGDGDLWAQRPDSPLQVDDELRAKLVRKLMASGFTGLSGFPDGEIFAFLDGVIADGPAEAPAEAPTAAPTAAPAEAPAEAPAAAPAEASENKMSPTTDAQKNFRQDPDPEAEGEPER